MTEVRHTLAELLGLSSPIQVADIGAAAIAEQPAYKALLDAGIGHLNAFDGDQRQHALIKEAYGDRCTVHARFVGDGGIHTAYIADPDSGMTSLLKPRDAALRFFNGFQRFGAIQRTETVQTCRLDDVEGLPPIHFLKMDIQGSELSVLDGASRTLAECVAIQLEVSFICLYEGQPSFGDVDLWMRARGFAPHRFIDVKRWSIAPTLFNNNVRRPGNQLLEADIVYIRDPLAIDGMSDDDLRRLALLADHCFGSRDLCVYAIRELGVRGAVPPRTVESYYALANSEAQARRMRAGTP